MPSRSARARAAIRTSLACLAIVMVVPVCITLWLEGADWTLSDSVQFSWYDEWVVWPLLAALIGWLLVASGDPPAAQSPAESRAASVSLFAHSLATLGLALTAVALGILWSGGVRFSFLSLRSPEPSAWGAIAFLLLSIFLGVCRPRAGPLAPRLSSFRSRLIALVSIVFALALGLLLQRSLASFDRHAMMRSIAAVSGGEDRARDGVRRPDVLWVVVDTLRADALGVYAAQGEQGAVVSRTPFLDSLAGRGVLFERALAPAPWTVPSMFAAFTALWPSSLDPEGRGRARRADDRIGLDPGVPTWIDRLREVGYSVAAFQKNPFLGEGSGLETRFDLYRMVGGDRAEGESAGQLVNAALRWGDAMQVHREVEATPYLLYLHFMDPHIDYAPPPAWLRAETSDISEAIVGTIDGRAHTLHRRLAKGPLITASEGAELARLYAAEVAYLDSELARLWSGLEERMLVGANTLVVVTGDHGEQFGEHGGWEHGDLFSENVHVPFLMAGDPAGAAPRRIAESVSLLDLGPTVLERLGLPGLEGAEGQSLLGDTVLADAVSARPIPSEYGARARLEFGRWVWIEGRGRAGEPDAALYDRWVDPREENDQSVLRPEIAERLRAELAAHRTRARGIGGRVRRISADERLEEELEALGYGSAPE